MNVSNTSDTNNIQSLYNQYNSYIIIANMFLNLTFTLYYGLRKLKKMCVNIEKQNDQFKETLENLKLDLIDMVNNKQTQEIKNLTNNVNMIKSNYNIQDEQPINIINDDLKKE